MKHPLQKIWHTRKWL